MAISPITTPRNLTSLEELVDKTGRYGEEMKFLAEEVLARFGLNDVCQIKAKTNYEPSKLSPGQGETILRVSIF